MLCFALCLLPFVAVYAADKPLSFSRQLERLKMAKSVNLTFNGTYGLGEIGTVPTNGIELNSYFEVLGSPHGLSYLTSDRNSIAKLVEILNKSVVKTPSPENPQLMYVNFMMTFEMKDQTKTHLLIGKYYEADPTIEAELHVDESLIGIIILDKMVHKTLRDWVLQYAQIDQENAFSNFQKECQIFYSREIKYTEESLSQDKKIFHERQSILRPLEIKILAQVEANRLARIEKYKQELAKCNDSDNPDYQKKLKRHIDVMLVNYFKNDANQVCDRHDLYHTDPNFCAARGEWQPSYNQWNINNLEDNK